MEAPFFSKGAGGKKIFFPFFYSGKFNGVFFAFGGFKKTGVGFFWYSKMVSLGVLFFGGGKGGLYYVFSGYQKSFFEPGFKKGFFFLFFTKVKFFLGNFWVFFEKNCWGNFLGAPLVGVFWIFWDSLFGGLWFCYKGVFLKLGGLKIFFFGGPGFFKFFLTLFLGVFFLFIQVFEYTHLFFNMSGWLSWYNFFFFDWFSMVFMCVWVWFCCFWVCCVFFFIIILVWMIIFLSVVWFIGILLMLFGCFCICRCKCSSKM
uniref:Cytochrome c oxidase subunit III n=1 Tax=Aspiculuris tetraptera TaxID=451377 RepID=A0A141HAU6_9BILA|nr:cytochrome c oxidase subunit III [Aspiculuris tetraptera]